MLAWLAPAEGGWMAVATTTTPVTGDLGARVFGVGTEMGCGHGGGICLCCCQGVLVLDPVCVASGVTCGASTVPCCGG